MNTSETRLTCFGKLPFRLLDTLQHDISFKESYWADAVRVPASDVALTTIDSVSLDSEQLPQSVVLAVLHSMNDVFAANGVPTSFSLSLILPPDTELQTFSEINQAVLKCAGMSHCRVGKIHTIRAEGTTSATVSVIGKPTDNSSSLAEQGHIVLVGTNGGWTHSDITTYITRELRVRQFAVANVRGPKKDISGDGLIGALYQLMLRHSISAAITARSIPDVTPIATEAASALYDRNYFDYSAFVTGEVSAANRLALFAPRIFGPLVCLTEHPIQVPDAEVETIGTFRKSIDSQSLVLV